MMDFDLRLMRFGPFQPWGFQLGGGLDRPLIVERVIPWTPAHNRLQIGDQILEIEGHFDCEVTSEEAELLAALKTNYLRLGVRRHHMFSNQYMGTRMASRSLPRPSGYGTSYNQGPYSQFTAGETAARQAYNRPEQYNGQGEEEDVDYTFMNLPVRERRKMFLSRGGPPPQFQPAGARSMTMPRTRSVQKTYATPQYDTQSEYGGGRAANRMDDLLAWEPSVQASWSQGAQSAAPRVPHRKSSTTGAIFLTPQRMSGSMNQPMETPIRQQAQYAVSAARSPSGHSPTPIPGRFFTTVRPTHQNISPSYHPQYSTTIRVHDPYAPQPRVVSDGSTRIYPNRRYHSAAAAPQPHGRPAIYNGEPWRASYLTVPGRVSQPLRVNVYNSDAASVQYSPTDRGDNAYHVNSPIYPAYPAHIERSYHTDQQMSRERYRRGQSVQSPMPAYQKPISPHVQRAVTQEVWRPMQAPNWMESAPRGRRQGRYISAPKPIPVNRAPTVDMHEQVGVSDF